MYSVLNLKQSSLFSTAITVIVISVDVSKSSCQGEKKMPDYYVSLVKEYLELQDFVVNTETRYKKNRGWGDIDILAVKIKANEVELIVGEVKANSQREKEIQEINENKFENSYVKQKLKELFGSTKYKKYLYCWSWEPKHRKFAESLDITPVSFGEIIDYLLKIVEERKGWLYLRDYPNIMLLQFLQSKAYKDRK